VGDQVTVTRVRVSTKDPSVNGLVGAKPGAPDADQIQGTVGLFQRDSKSREPLDRTAPAFKCERPGRPGRSQ
jgi:hypothetical protein